MSRWDSRSQQATRSTRTPILSMLRSAGRAAGWGRNESAAPVAFADGCMERLEERVLLAGDEPNFNQVFGTGTPLTPPVIVLDAGGAGTSTGGSGMSTIGPAGDNDVFKFTAPASDFVTLWADTLATGSTLDSRIEVYTGTPGGTATLVASGSTQGTLTSGVFKDGWVGFKAVAGTQYFVVVKSDLLSGTGSIGDYVLRIDALSTAFPTLSTTSGLGQVTGNIAIRGGDIIYKVTTGSNVEFNGVMTMLGQSDPADLDPRLDVYSEAGAPIRNDSDTGNLTDSYLAVGSAKDRTFYVRVRSDEFGNPALEPSTGAFTLIIDGIASTVNIDPVTRLGASGIRNIPNQKSIQFLQFQAQGSGLSFITINVGVLGGLPDSAVRLYNSAGALIGFNELNNAFSRMLIQLTGGERYFVVVENFGGNAGGNFNAEFEAHHTFDAVNTTPVLDDHISRPTGFVLGTPPTFGTPEWYAANRQFELATPIVWGAPQNAEPPGFAPGLPALNTPVAPIQPDHSMVIIGRMQGRIHAAGDTDLFQFTVPVDMAGEFPGIADMNTSMPPPLWRSHYRPATSIQVLVTAGTLFNAQVRIFDSNLAQIYPTGTGANDILLTPGFPDPAGALDPAAFPPALPIPDYGYTFAGGQPARIEVWAGEVYYIEVSGAGTGRYTGEIDVDAPIDLATVSDFGPELAKAGNFAGAREILIDPTSGEGRNYTNAAAGAIQALPGGMFRAVPGIGAAGVNHGRTYFANLITPAPPTPPPPPGAGAGGQDLLGTPGSRGRLIFRMSDLGVIQSPTDTNLYQFRALYTGTAEVRIASTQIADEFFEGIVQTEDGDPMTPPVIEGILRKNKTYNSPLDSALRIFDNDQTEIAYNNDNSVTGGETDDRNVGSAGVRTFQRRDPRAVFPVEAGKIYYVQVESGQLQNFNLTFPKVDWRHASGSYELMINSMSNLNFDDDHQNNSTLQSTPIPINLNTTSTTATLGAVNGEIRNTAFNTDDSDAFQFIAPATGAAKITVATRLGDSFTRIVSVFDAGAQLIGTTTVTGTADAVVNVLAAQGDLFYVLVDQPANPPGPQGLIGRYQVRVSGVPYADDHASEPFYFGATGIDSNLYDYDGTETLDGSIESFGDTDTFSFTTIAFDVVTVTVQSLSPSFHPTVRIYEISKDPANNPILLNIGYKSAGTGSSATYTFSVTAPPRTSGADQFNTYFVVVGGVDLDADAGDYTMTLSFPNTTDDHPDAGQYAIADPITLSAGGIGSAAGSIELAGDTDLFQFVSASQGLATITLTSPAGSLLFPRIRVFDSNQQPVSDVNGQFFVTGPDQLVSTAVFKFTASRNVTYYVQIEGATPFGNMVKTAETGAYTVDFNTPIPDDHPNVGEFTIADPIILSPFSGDGSANGQLEIGTDTDLFKFVAVANGTMVVTLGSPGNQFRPFLRFFGPDQVEIGTAVRDGGPGDEDGQLDGSVRRTMQGMVLASTYYVLASSDQTEPTNHQTGGYTFLLNGTAPPQGPDDHPDAGDFTIASLIPLDLITGDASLTGMIEVSTDSDLFVFNSLAGSVGSTRRAFIQVLTAAGLPLDVGVRIFKNVNGTPTQIGFDSAGGPGTNAEIEFDIDAANAKYWVEIDGLGGTGAYTIKIDTAPDKYFLYYPEGFANSAIREYIAIGNDNNFDVTYTVTLRYEDATIPDRQFTRVIAAHSRGGETISDGTANPPSGVVFNKPYTIIIESTGFLGANISHYDFGNTLGESFTGRTSSTWSFAQGQKLHGAVNDFLIYYNPNPNLVRVTFTAFLTDPITHNVSTVSVAQIVGAFRRSGWNIDDTPTLPVGTFAFTVTSEPVTPGDSHMGIVAALSHYDLGNSDGYAVLGDPDGGATSGVIPGMVSGASAAPMLTLFNPTATVATVNIVGRYISSSLPNLIKSVTLQPGESATFDSVGLGLVQNETVGLRYDSNVAVTVLAETRQGGDADGTHANTEAGKSFFFGDAFINRLRAGTLYFEDMYFYNPDSTALPITLNFQFNDGGTSSYTFSVGPKDFATVALHTLPAILNHAVFNFFSINAVAANPFAVTMTHYDLVLAGGWGTKGAPLGLTNQISTIIT